jgi:hypothetical protein
MLAGRSVRWMIIGMLLWSVFAGLLFAQTATFEATVDRNPVGVGEQFTLSLTLTGGGMGGGKNLQLPDLGKFHIMSGPNQSSSVQIINGSVSSTISYSYILQPKETGKIAIGAASIEANGATYKTQPFVIEVTKATSRPRQQAAAADDKVELGDNLFLRATVDRSQIVQGEQINLSFKLYTRVSVVNYAVTKTPTMTGFWSEDVEVPKNITLGTETINGKSYHVGVIKRAALFATQSGTLEIGPMEVQATVQVRSRSNDPFESFFRDPFGRNVNYAVSSEPLKIKVEALPAGAPPEFKGAIGQFAMSTVVDKKSTRTNEPVTLKVTISGTGNIKLIEAPQLDVPPDFEQYSPKVSDNISRGSGRISGSKTFEYLMLPRYPGLKVIKPVTMTYFDLGKREYVRLRSPQIELNVEQGTAPQVPLIAGAAREDVRMLSQDIRFIKVANVAFSRVGSLPYTRVSFLVLLALPLAAVAGVWLLVRRRKEEMLDQAGYRNRRAMKVAKKGLHEAEVLLNEKGGKSGEPSSAQRLRFYAEVSRALWKYLGDKLNIPQAEFSVAGAAAAITDHSADPALVESLRSLLETCDMARFAPTSLELTAMRNTYEEARRIIVELERTLKPS